MAEIFYVDFVEKHSFVIEWDVKKSSIAKWSLTMFNLSFFQFINLKEFIFFCSQHRLFDIDK